MSYQTPLPTYNDNQTPLPTPNIQTPLAPLSYSSHPPPTPTVGSSKDQPNEDLIDTQKDDSATSVQNPGIKPQLQNIVSTVNLDCKLDLKQIAQNARNAEYNPKRFAAVIMRIREPKTTALIFGSGKMVCTGAKSEDESRVAARKYARIIHKLGFKVKFTDFKIQNVVGSCDVKFPIRLEGLSLDHQAFCSYEPELFPGLIYRMLDPKIVFLIFVSGKIVLTGAKKKEDIQRAFDEMYPVLLKYRKISADEEEENGDEREDEAIKEAFEGRYPEEL